MIFARIGSLSALACGALWLATAQALGQAAGLAAPEPQASESPWAWLLPLLLLGVGGLLALVPGMKRLSEVVGELQQRDALTGLWLPSKLLEVAAIRLKDAVTPGQRTYVFLVEMDDLDRLNETYGVIAADEVLIATAGLLAGFADHGEDGAAVLGRWSGNRFAGLFKAADDQAATAGLLALSGQVAELDIHFGGAPVSVSISTAFGVLAGSRAEDVEAGFKLVQAELGEKPPAAAGRIIEAPTPARQKRTFVRDSDDSLART